VLLSTFQISELKPYLPLCVAQLERWEGNPQQDRILLDKLLRRLETTVSIIRKVVRDNLANDPSLSKTMHKLELYQLPIILKLICRLFTKEFEI